MDRLDKIKQVMIKIQDDYVKSWEELVQVIKDERDLAEDSDEYSLLSELLERVELAKQDIDKNYKNKIW